MMNIHVFHTILSMFQEAMLRQDPDHLKRTAEMMRGMKGEDLRRMLALSGMEVPPGFSDDDVKRMADSVRHVANESYYIISTYLLCLFYIFSCRSGNVQAAA